MKKEITLDSAEELRRFLAAMPEDTAAIITIETKEAEHARKEKE